MPVAFEEPSAAPTLRFTFDDDWQVLRLDEDPFFKTRLMPLQLTRAVDFLGLHRRRRELYFIEVKDYRGSRIELKNAEKMYADDTLMLQVARKVKDSVACVVGAARHRTGNEFWRNAAEIIHQPARALRVILWLEFDLPRPRRRIAPHSIQTQRFQAELGPRTDSLKRHLSWLTRHVLVTNRSAGVTVPGIAVENVGRAGNR